MNVRSFLLRVALALGIVLLAGQPAAHAQDADAVFDRLQKKYNSLQALRAEFTQTMTSSFSEEEARSSGTLVLQGDQYRVETGAQVLVANGSETYVYLPQQKQVIINDATEDETAFSPSEFLTRYDERFRVERVETETLGGAKHFKLTLAPRDPSSFFRQATLWLRDRDDIITRLEVLDVNETRMLFELKNVELNPRLERTTFIFEAPSGVEVIDLRS